MQIRNIDKVEKVSEVKMFEVVKQYILQELQKVREERYSVG